MAVQDNFTHVEVNKSSKKGKSGISEANHLTMCKQNLAFSPVVRVGGLKP